MATSVMELAPTYCELLVSGVAANDGAAMEELWSLLKRTVRWQLLRRVGPQEVEDLLSETFLRVVLAIQERGLRHPDGLVRFARTVAERTGNNRVGQLMRGRERVASFDLAWLPRGGLNAEEAMLLAERDALWRDRFGALAAGDRDILDRFYLAGESRESIQLALGLSEKQFALKKWRALAKVVPGRVVPRVVKVRTKRQLAAHLRYKQRCVGYCTLPEAAAAATRA